MDSLLLAFDMDGTLIDSGQDVCNAVNKTAADLGKPPIPDEIIIAHIGEGLRKLLADLLPEARDNPEHAEQMERLFIRNYEAEMLKTTVLYPGVEDFLARFPGNIAIITNKNKSQTFQIVEHLKLDRFPWVHIFGADSLAERKPSPLPMQTVMKTWGGSQEHAFMIGDGTPDMVSANRAGVKSIAISFGYTDLGLLRAHNPWAILDSYTNLYSLLENWKVHGRTPTEG